MRDEEREAARLRIEHLTRQYIRHNDRGLRFGRFNGLVYALDHLRNAYAALEFIRTSGRDPYDTLKDVGDVLRDAQSGLQGTRDVAREDGFLELLDDHFEALIRSVDSTLLDVLPHPAPSPRRWAVSMSI